MKLFPLSSLLHSLLSQHLFSLCFLCRSVRSICTFLVEVSVFVTDKLCGNGQKTRTNSTANHLRKERRKKEEKVRYLCLFSLFSFSFFFCLLPTHYSNSNVSAVRPRTHSDFSETVREMTRLTSPLVHETQHSYSLSECSQSTSLQRKD
jgi:hypothetical protein